VVDAENTPLLPMVLLDSEGRPLRGALSSEKAYKKSLESGTLWGVNPETGRVLPLEGVRRLVGIERDGTSVTARVVPAGGSEAGAEAGPGTGPAPRETAPAAGGPPTAGPDAEAGRGTEAGSGTGVLEALEGVIASRREEMKEGSYTTYLFEKGLEKIRKKTGEEAIELLLATDPREITSEAADLLYHLLVLLRALEIPLSAVLGELEARLKR
jgi:phosphoribosyl-ATP pyrophosphohydrolase